MSSQCCGIQHNYCNRVAPGIEFRQLPSDFRGFFSHVSTSVAVTISRLIISLKLRFNESFAPFDEVLLNDASKEKEGAYGRFENQEIDTENVQLDFTFTS